MRRVRWKGYPHPHVFLQVLDIKGLRRKNAQVLILKGIKRPLFNEMQKTNGFFVSVDSAEVRAADKFCELWEIRRLHKNRAGAVCGDFGFLSTDGRG